MIEFEDDISLDSPSIEMVDYRTVQARKFSKDTHLMIITKRQTKEELDADYAQYLRLTIKQKLKANDMASKLFGMTNDQLYNQYKKAFEFGKEDASGYVDTTSDINTGLNHDYINNTEDDMPMDIITRDVNRDTFVGQLQESMDLENIEETNSGIDNPAFFTPYEILTYEGLYSDTPDVDSINEDISVLDWYNNYTRSFNGLITENYYLVWLEKMRSLYSDYDRLEGQALLDRQQSIVNLGWNPEIPFNEHNIEVGKKRLERECKYAQDIYEDYSQLGELSDKATAINESIDTKKDLPVYVVLTKGNIPFLSDAIRAFTDSEYSHAGIAFDPELDKIHSFAIAGSSGYQVENIRSRTSVESVFLFFLKKEKVLAMQKEIGNFAMNVNKTTYSMGGLIGKAVNVKYSNGNKYNQVCSSFVNYVLQIGGIDFVKTKNNSLASPADIYNALMTRPKNVYKVYEGEGDKYDSKKTSKIVKAIIKAKESKALHPIRTIKDRITANEDYIEEKAKPNVCYRVVYDGADIYQNIKMGMFNDTRGMKEWENFTASKKYTWDQVPSDKKPSGSKVYYTEKGLKTFNSKVLPTAKLYLDKSKIKTQVFMMDPEKISYKDEYHIVASKALSKVHESVELPDIYENIPYGYFGMFLEEAVDITNSIELPDTTEVSKVIKSVPKEEPEFVTEALNLPPGYTLRSAKASDMDYMYECEMSSIEPRLARQKKVQDYIRQDVKDAVKDTKIIMYKKDVVGVFTCCYIDGGERWYIAEVFVDKAHRGNGIATALIKNELSKHPKVRLQVALSNGKAKRLYERLGFEVTKKDEKNGMYIMDWEKGKSVEEFPDKDTPVIQEANKYAYLSSCIERDDIVHNIDMWESGESNILWVTGLSGSGKSTLSKDLAKRYGAEYVEVDRFQRAKQLSWTTTDCPMIDAYIKSVGGLDNIFPWCNSVEKLTWKTFVDNEEGMDKEYGRFFTFIMDYAAKHRNRKFIIEGVQIFFYSDPKFVETLSNSPVIIKMTGPFKTEFRREVRQIQHHKDDATFKQLFHKISTHIKNWVKGGFYLDDWNKVKTFKQSIGEACSVEEFPDKNEPVIQEANEYSYLSPYIERNDIVHNINMWESGESNVIWVTGLSGSGKSSIGKDLSKRYKAKYIELDLLVTAKLKLKTSTGDDIIDSYIDSVGGMDNVFPWCNSVEKITIKIFTDNKKGMEDEYQRFFNYLFDYISTNKNQRFVVEGVQIFCYAYSHPEFVNTISESPVIIKMAGPIKTEFRREHRSYMQYKDKVSFVKLFSAISASIFKYIANGMYLDDWNKVKTFKQSIGEACKDVDAARHFVSDVKDLAKKYDANFFLVTDGASGTHNDGTNAAVKHARDTHKEWELKHGFDPEEDWGKGKKKSVAEAVSMDDEGNMIIYRATLNTLDYGDAINKSSELCKLYKQSSNIEGIKYELCKLWYINCMLEKKIKRNDKNKEKYVNDRRICLNVFKTYMKHVNTIDDDFNFVEYYNATPYGGAIRIDKNTLKYSIKALKELMK